MEEIKKKLEYDNPSIKFKALSRLIHLIEKKKPNGDPISKLSPKINELEYLWDLTEHNCPLIRNGACRALVSLTLNGHVEFSYILEGMFNRVPTTKSLNGYIMALSDLMILQHSSDVVQPSKRFMQHPFIAVLKQGNKCWPYILEQIKFLLSCKENRKSIMDAIFPFLQYILWDSCRPASLSYMRLSLWKILVNKCSGVQDSGLRGYLFQSIKWLKLDTCLDLQESLEFLQILACSPFQKSDDEMDLLILSLSTVCLQMTKEDIDPSSGLQTLLEILKNMAENRKHRIYIEASALLVSLMLEISISKQELLLLKLVEIFVSSGNVSILTAASFLMPLLQVITTPVIFASVLDNKPSSQQRAASLIRHIEKSIRTYTITDDKWEENDAYIDSLDIEVLHASASYAMHSARIIQKIQLTPFIAYEWLDGIEPLVESVNHEWKFLSHTIAGIIMHGLQHKQIVRKAVSVLVAIARADQQQAPSMFPILLHKLSVETDVDLRLHILHSLPEMATHKVSVGPVLQTLQILSSTPSLQALSIRLTSKLWQLQDRVFPFLHHLILEPEEKKDDGIGFDVLIAKAASIKDVCQIRPHQYGADLLNSLSALLARNLKESGSVPSVLALEGIIALCKSEVIDLHTTWKVLAAKLSKDSRPQVVKKLCELLSIAPELEVNNLEFETFKQEIIAYLWKQVNANKNPIMVGAAYKALGAFKPENYKFKHLPEKAKEGLVLPKNLAATPFEKAKKPEDVLTYIPGSCFIKLLSSVDEQVLKDYGEFLAILIKDEVKDMPRGVYHSTWRLNKVTQSNKTLAAIPGLLANKHEYNKVPGLQGSLAGGVLLSFEPPVEYGKNDQPLRRSFATQARAYQQKLEVLLNEVPIGAAEWQRSLALLQAWGSYMERTYFVSVEGRKAELEMQKHHGTLPGGPEEYEVLTSKAWLWVRDRLAESLKAAAKGKPAAQGNAVLALGALAAAVSKYISTVDDESSKKLLSDSGEHLGHDYWLSLVFETIMTVIDSSRPSKSRIFTWFQGSEKGGSISMLVRACGAVSIAQLAPTFTSSHTEKASQVIDKLMTMLTNSDSPAIQLYAGLGIGLHIAQLYQSHFAESGGAEAQSLLTTAVKNLLQYALNDDLDSKVGSVLGLTAATCAMCFDSNSETRLYASDIHSMILEKLESESHLSVIHEVLCLSLVSITAAVCTMQILLMEVAENALRKLENLLKKSPNNCGIASSLGLMIYWLQRISYPNAPAMKDHLLKIWLPTLASEASSTLSRLAAVHGLCSLFGLQSLLMQIPDDILEVDSDVGLNELLRLMSEIVSVSKDIGMQNCCAWMLGQLYLVTSKRGSNRISLPLNYSYLNESSILRAVVDYICESLKKKELNESDKAEHLEICFQVLSQQFSRALPPLNWVTLLTPFISCGNNKNLSILSIKTALNQCTSSTAAASVISTCIYGPFFITLSIEAQCLVLRNMPQLFKSIPCAKLQSFLKSEVHSLFNSLEGKEMVTAALEGLKSTLEVTDLQPDKKLILYETIENIFSTVQSLEKETRTLYCECLLKFPEEILERITTVKDLADVDEIETCLSIRCYLVAQQKCQIVFLNNIVDAIATSGSAVDLEALSTCFQSLSTSNRDDCIEWIFRIMGQTRNVMEWKSNLHLSDTDHMTQAVNCYVDVFVVALVAVSYSFMCFPPSFYPNNLSIKFELLPLALQGLTKQQLYENMTSKVVDWIIYTCESSVITTSRRKYLKASLCGLRHMDELKKTSTWTHVVTLYNETRLS